MPETSDWSTAPKDGTVIDVKFEDGTETEARFSTLTRQWEVIYGPRKEWRRMEYVHKSPPICWWPLTDDDDL